MKKIQRHYEISRLTNRIIPYWATWLFFLIGLVVLLVTASSFYQIIGAFLMICGIFQTAKGYGHKIGFYDARDEEKYDDLVLVDKNERIIDHEE